MQVVTNENIQELVQTGRVAEFKPPEAPKEPVSDGAPSRDPETGKFVKSDADTSKNSDKPSEEKSNSSIDNFNEKGDKQSTDAMSEDDEGNDDLPEKVRKVIGKKHRQLKEAEEFGKESYLARLAADRRAESLERELAEIKSKSGRAQVETAKAEPKPEDFKTVAEYTKALVDFEVAKARDEERRSIAEERQKEQAAQARAELNKRIAKAAKDIPDYEEVMSQSDIDVPPHIAQYITESELGPKIGYHFATHEDDFDRISKLSPVRALAELGKLEAKLEGASGSKDGDKTVTPITKPVQEVSKAPAPIVPLDGKSTPVNKDPATMTFQELRAYENERRRARARA